MFHLLMSIHRVSKRYQIFNNQLSFTRFSVSRRLHSLTYTKNYNKSIRSLHNYNINNTDSQDTSKKTKIFNISDLHLEYYDNPHILYQNIKHLLPHADILVLAGDVGYPMGNHGDNYMFLLDKFKQQYNYVILVPGNHEYFQTKHFDREKTMDALRTICEKTSCHLLDNKTIDLNGVRFIGTTLWTDIDPRLKYLVDTKGKTFGIIFKDFESYQDEYQKCFRFLKNQLSKKHEKKVIITHHVPSYSLQHPKYRDRNHGSIGTDSMFYSEILDFLNLADVKYWFCGHTHESGSIVYSNTQIIVNPYGCPWEQSKRLTKISKTALSI